MRNAGADLPTPSLPVRRDPDRGSLARNLVLALSVVVLAASGLSATAGAAGAAEGQAGSGPSESGTVPVPGGGVGSTVTRRPVRITAHTRRARVGGTIRLKGSTGLASSSRVRVEVRLAGSPAWRVWKVALSTAAGRFRTRIRARKNGSIRVRDRFGRVSAPVKTRIRSRIRLKRVARTVKLGDRLRISGSVRPRGVRRVRIRVSGAGTTAVVRTRRSGRFTWRWKPVRAGDVRIRALAFGNPLALRSRSGKRRSSALRPGGASYYGPGLYGNGVACGGVLRPGTIGVAHKTLPCGTRVMFRYGNRIATARVIDRGPYVAGRDWDLTEALRNRLGFGGVGTVWTNR